MNGSQGVAIFAKMFQVILSVLLGFYSIQFLGCFGWLPGHFYGVPKVF